MKILRKRGIYTASFPRKNEFINVVHDWLDKARQVTGYNNMPTPAIVFYEKGRAAGMASATNGDILNLEFNVHFILNNWDEMISDTVPHEIAHLVDYWINGKFNAHGAEWQRIMRQMGVNPSRTHDMKVKRARRTRRYSYIAKCGTNIWVTTQIHKKIQMGYVRIVRKTGGQIDRNCYTGKEKWVE